MPVIVDARNLRCPEPVVLTRQALENAAFVVTIVDNDAAKRNVLQLAKNEGCETAVEARDDGTYVTMVRTRPWTPGAIAEEAPAPSAAALLITSRTIGKGGSEQLGALLMQMFLHALNGQTARPETIIFMNEGVWLVTDDSPALEDLRRLEADGVEILACGTCLTHLHLIDRVAVGQVTNMQAIADTLLRAERTLSL